MYINAAAVWCVLQSAPAIAAAASPLQLREWVYLKMTCWRMASLEAAVFIDEGDCLQLLLRCTALQHT
jgi:hypothetical protein